MKNLLCTLLCSLVPLFAGNFGRADETSGPGRFRIAGYMPDYRLAAFDPSSFDGLTDLILFSAELSQDGALDLARLKNCPWARLLRFKTQSRVRLILTIGGWERSQNFGSIALAPAKREKCVKSLVRFALDHRLDGIDLDWEHPKNRAEEDAYGQLLQDLHTAFEPHGLMLSVTIASWQRLSRQALSAVDHVQIMAYDYDGKHSTYEQVEGDLRKLIDAGMPAEKIILGLPFYGRDIKTRKAMSYADVIAQHAPNRDVNQVGQVYFNGPRMMERKVELAIRTKLGGVMVWELGQDAAGEHALLSVIRNTAPKMPTNSRTAK